MNAETGKWIMVAALLLLLAGIFTYFFHDKLNWLGRLPGDVRIERKGFRFYFPFTTMLLLSLLATILINLVKKFIG